MKPLAIFTLALTVCITVNAQHTVLEDHFWMNNNKWPLVYNKNTQMGFVNSHFSLRNTVAGHSFCTIPIAFNPHRSFEVTVDAYHHFGENAAGFGLLFGGRDGENIFGFEINAAGLSRVYKIQSGDTTALAGWHADAAILQGDVQNTMAIKWREANWVFSINGTTVATVPEQDVFGPLAGFVSHGRQAIEYGTLKVMGYDTFDGYAEAPNLYKDDFSKAKKMWGNDADYILAGGHGSSKIDEAKGRLVITTDKDSSIDRGITLPLNMHNTFDIYIDAERSNTDDSDSYFGLHLEDSAGKQGVGFYVSPRNTFTIQRLDSGSTTWGGDWFDIPEGKTSAGKTNLHIHGQDGWWAMFVNNTYAGSIKAKYFDKLGLYFTTVSSQTVEFDNFAINGEFVKEQ